MFDPYFDIDVLGFTDEELAKIESIGGLDGYLAVFEDRLKAAGKTEPKPEVKPKEDYMAGGGFEFF